MNAYDLINQEHSAQLAIAESMEAIVAQADKDGYDVLFVMDEVILTERKQESK